MADTKFLLSTGVPCVVKELEGKHQRLLTENEGKNLSKALIEIIIDCTVSIGSVTQIDEEFVNGLLTCDRDLILEKIRNFALDHDPVFKFMYEYKSSNGDIVKTPMSVDISGGFKLKKPILPTGEEQVCQEYSEVIKEFEYILPRSGKKVAWKALTVKAEGAGAKIPKNSISSHTPLMLRNVREFIPTKNGETPTQVNFDKLGLKDIEALRAEIYRVEGELDSSIKFAHPETGEILSQSALGSVSFFFPSGRI